MAALWIQLCYVAFFLLLIGLYDAGDLSIYSFRMLMALSRITMGLHLKLVLFHQILLYVAQVMTRLRS
jgi:hypothetical protein